MPDFTNYGTGYVMDPAGVYPPWVPTGATLPAKHILPFRGPVYNQGFAATSPAHAVASLKAQQEFKEHRAYFDFDVNTFALSVPAQDLTSAVTLLGSFGYLAKQEEHKLDNPFAFPATTPLKLADLTEIKEALLAGNPVLLGVEVDVGLRSPNVLGVLPEPLGATTDAQAFVVYGWDDTKELEVGTGALYLKNSWGTDYGVNGFVWMGYNYLTTYNFDAWVVTDSADTLP